MAQFGIPGLSDFNRVRDFLKETLESSQPIG
jgi:hypothetical protein